nr:anthranilate phosphoribosyltransferase [Sphingomonas vulcanisoli]
MLPDPANPLDHSQAEQAFADILDGTVADEVVAAFLIALAERGETSIEIAAAARAMRQRMLPIEAPENAIDVCGTGGDGHHTLNVSTAVALVVAACGVPVAKHGNRAASSKAGAADTLEALGLDMARAGDTAEASLAALGICFLFAANHHPAMRRIQPIRTAIGRRTIFNLMGPLANPARTRRQLIGIARPDYVGTYAQALALIGDGMAWVVSGEEGIDEISIAGPTVLAEVRGAETHSGTLTPEEASLPCHPIAAIRGGDAAHNAQALRRLLKGEAGAYRDAVLLNAAGALTMACEVADLSEGVVRAAEAIDSGAAEALLDRWLRF